MLYFDIILDMYWLHMFYATIDCRNRVVWFKFPNELETEWEGHGSSTTSKVVSNFKATKMLSKGLGPDENLSYKEVSVKIIDRQVKWSRNKEVATVKVL